MGVVRRFGEYIQQIDLEPLREINEEKTTVDIKSARVNGDFVKVSTRDERSSAAVMQEKKTERASAGKRAQRGRENDENHENGMIRKMKYIETIKICEEQTEIISRMNADLLKRTKNEDDLRAQIESTSREREKLKEDLKAVGDASAIEKNRMKLWQTQKKEELEETKDQLKKLRDTFERKINEYDIERMKYERDLKEAKASNDEKANSERIAHEERDCVRSELENTKVLSKEMKERLLTSEEDNQRLKEALLERRKMQDALENELREHKKNNARLQGELRGRREMRKSMMMTTPTNNTNTRANKLTLASTTTTTTTTPMSNSNNNNNNNNNNEHGRPAWDDSFYSAAHNSKQHMRPIAFPDTPTSNMKENDYDNDSNNNAYLKDAFRNVKAFGQEIAHSWRERATRAEQNCEQLERNLKAIQKKLVDEQLKNVKLTEDLEATRDKIERVESDRNAEKHEIDQLREKYKNLSQELTQTKEKCISVEHVAKTHREAAVDGAKRVRASESVLDALKSKERDATRLKELSEQRLEITERELQSIALELEKARQSSWKLVELQEITTRRAEIAEKKLAEHYSDSVTNFAASTTTPNTVDRWLSTTPGGGKAVAAWTRTPLRA